MQASGAHAAIAYLFALRDETRAQTFLCWQTSDFHVNCYLEVNKSFLLKNFLLKNSNRMESCFQARSLERRRRPFVI